MIVIELSLAELGCIKDALRYAQTQMADSFIPVFGSINGDSGESYTDDEVEQAYTIAEDLCESINSILNHDEGVIIIRG